MIVWTFRQSARAAAGAEVRRCARVLAVGAAVRAIWLLPVAGDPYWRSPAMFALLAATLITIVTATMIAARPDRGDAPHVS